MKPEWKKVLSLRSKRDKFAVHIYNRPSSISKALDELKVNGYIVWLDCTLVCGTTFADVYLLTPKGAKFCDDHGIVQQ
jgi:hypothetical protein